MEGFIEVTKIEASTFAFIGTSLIVLVKICNSKSLKKNHAYSKILHKPFLYDCFYIIVNWLINIYKVFPKFCVSFGTQQSKDIIKCIHNRLPQFI